jgi:predicted CXXCH cytochrome family protein
MDLIFQEVKLLKKRLITFTLFLFIFSITSLTMASGIVILAPTDGASVSSKDIVIIGKASGNAKEVKINGVLGDGLRVKVNNGGFFAKIKLIDGSNKVTLSADDGASLEMNINVNETEGFSYHPSDSDILDCSSCHSEVDSRGYALKPAANVCYECHDSKSDMAFVHGPINVGICNVCHMPHGSNIKGMLMVDNTLICSGCHEDLIPTHPNTANKYCVDCHDPHASDKEFHIK